MDQNQQQIQTMDKTEKEFITPGGSPGIVLETPPSKDSGFKDSGGGQPLFCKDKDALEKSSHSSNLKQLTLQKGLLLSNLRPKSSLSVLSLSDTRNNDDNHKSILGKTINTINSWQDNKTPKKKRNRIELASPAKNSEKRNRTSKIQYSVQVQN
ncbi:unnamed protein product [Lasius platythorax]|uniref:Uncharacterized protein n=1 Tax=Lasius platythorax TaxID=488582 RepID=A0AAV2NZP2_9HYME